MPRYALVELSTMMVLNVATVNTVPTAPWGFRNIIENTTNPALNEWTPGDDPAINEMWDGQIPAGFAPAPVIPPEEIPGDLTAVNERLTALQAEIDKIKAGVEQIQGG